MKPTYLGFTCLTIAIVGGSAAICQAQARAAAWLDESKPRSWNTPRASIPAAPTVRDPADPRCVNAARPPESDADRRLREKGWQLVGPYQAGWQVLVVRATAHYDGMCRPRGYQDFVFVRGVFVGTLSPQPMDSRTDGALSRVTIQSVNRVAADYLRYAPNDPLCCPSKTTTVTFDIDPGTQVVHPVSVSTTGR